MVGAGTLFPDEHVNPVVHLHIACGREDHTLTGCVRLGVRGWHVMEAILVELVDTRATRRLEPTTGSELLQP